MKNQNLKVRVRTKVKRREISRALKECSTANQAITTTSTKIVLILTIILELDLPKINDIVFFQSSNTCPNLCSLWHSIDIIKG